MFKFLKLGLLGTALLFTQPVMALDLPVLQLGTMLQDTDSHTYTHILGLKPIPDSYQLAKTTFLPDASESAFGNRDSLDRDYNTAECTDKSSLYTTKNCTYPRAVVYSSKCPFSPGYYKECACLPQFKISSCTSPKTLSSPTCNGKAESCICPSTVTLTNPNDICTKSCDGKCVAKSCTPSANEAGCQYGTTTESDGCGGTRTICLAKPVCSSSSSNYCAVHNTCHGDCCTDGSIKPCDTRCGGSGCSSCNFGDTCSGYSYSSCPAGKTCSSCSACGTTKYKVSGNSCTADSCSGYSLSFCPSGGNCSSCTITKSDCSTNGTKYKLDSCKSGYEKSSVTEACLAKRGNSYYEVIPNDYNCCIFTTINGSQQVYETQWNCNKYCEIDGEKFYTGTTYCIISMHYSTEAECLAQDNCHPHSDYGYYPLGGTNNCRAP